MRELEMKSINTIRMLSVDQIEKQNQVTQEYVRVQPQ